MRQGERGLNHNFHRDVHPPVFLEHPNLMLLLIPLLVSPWGDSLLLQRVQR